jgi:hypothetical protein
MNFDESYDDVVDAWDDAYEDAEAYDDGEAWDDSEAWDDGEAWDDAEDFGEARKRRHSRKRGRRIPSRLNVASGQGLKKSLHSLGNRPPARGTINTPAGQAQLKIPNVATTKDLKKVIDGVASDLKKNAAAILELQKKSNQADSGIFNRTTDLNSRIKSMQFQGLAGLFVQPKLETLVLERGISTNDGATTTYQVQQAKTDNTFPLIAAFLPFVLGAVQLGPKSGTLSKLMPFLIVGALIIWSNWQKGDQADNSLNRLLDDKRLLALGALALLSMNNKTL